VNFGSSIKEMNRRGETDNRRDSRINFLWAKLYLMHYYELIYE